MDFEKALEFAVISAWDDLVKPADKNSIHVEYTDVEGTPVGSLQVWATHKGHGYRVCDYTLQSSKGSQLQGTQFFNTYASQTLSETLDLIMLNQGRFTRPPGRDVHGLVQVSVPSKEGRVSAANWWHTMMTNMVRNADVQPQVKLGTVSELKTRVN